MTTVKIQVITFKKKNQIKIKTNFIKIKMALTVMKSLRDYPMKMMMMTIVKKKILLPK